MARNGGAKNKGQLRPSIWHEHWGAFMRNKGAKSWWDCFRSKGPLYVIPRSVLVIVGGRAGKRGILSENELRCELAFSRLCTDGHQDICGVWGTEPIFFGLLSEAPPPDQIDEELIRAWRYGNRTFEEKKAALRYAGQITKSSIIRRLMLRRAGELACTLAFLEEIEPLRQSWMALTNPVAFPLFRTRLAAWKVEANRLPVRTASKLNAFLEATEAFLGRWDLQGMATWDLPIPVGHYERVPASVLVNLLGDPRISAVGSQHIPVPRKDVSDTTAALSWVESKKPKKRVRVQAGSLYEFAFEMKFWELAIRNRYGLRHGMTNLLLEAAQENFRVGRKRAEQIRHAYLPSSLNDLRNLPSDNVSDTR